MFFTINNKRYLSKEQLRKHTLLNAYYIVQKYPLRAADLLMDQYITQQYDMTLKDMCVKLLLNLTLYEDQTGNLLLLFKDSKHDNIASLITYGNGAIPGSKILQDALRN